MRVRKIISSRNVQNSFWNILEIILPPVLFFISIPFLLKYLGDEKYGVWMFINTIIIFMQSLDFGLSVSTYKHIANYLSKGQENEIIRTINTNISLSLLIGGIAFVIITALAAGIYYKNYFIGTSADKLLIIKGLFLGVIILTTKLLEKLLFNIFRAYEDFKVVTQISTSIKFITVLVNILLAIYTGNVLYILSSVCLMQCLSLWLCYGQVRKRIQGYSFRFNFQKEHIKKETGYSVFAWLQSIAVIIAYQSDRLIVSSFLGMTVLTHYSIASIMFNHIHMAFSGLTSWLFPQVAKNSSDKDYIKYIYLNTRNVATVVAVTLLCIFSLAYAPLFTFWLGEDKLSEIKPYIQWFTVFEFFFIYTINSYYFLNASGNEKLALKITLVFTSVNFIGMIVAFAIYRSAASLVTGLAVSSVVAMLLLHIMMNLKLKVKRPVLDAARLLIPPFFGSVIILTEHWQVKGMFFIFCMLSLYVVFFVYSKTSVGKILG